jgi:ABC-type molybdate transport system substrate-binding protein
MGLLGKETLGIVVFKAASLKKAFQSAVEPINL